MGGLGCLAGPWHSTNSQKTVQTAASDQIGPTGQSETELQRGKVWRYILKCQTYFKGLGLYFSPAFRIVSAILIIRILFSYFNNDPHLKPFVY